MRTPILFLALIFSVGCAAPAGFEFTETKNITYLHALPVTGEENAYIFTDLKDSTHIQIKVKQFLADHPKSESIVFYDTLKAKVKKISDKADVPDVHGKYLLIDIY